MSAHLPGLIATLISARTAYTVATDNDVPGTTAGGALLGADYDKWPYGQRVIVTGNGNRYTKTSMTLYADGGRITQEGSATAPTVSGIDGLYTCGAGDAVGAVVYQSGTNLVASAIATTASQPPIGVIVSKPTATSCYVRTSGEAVVLTEDGLAMTADSDYFLSAALAGTVTLLAPATLGNVSVRVGRSKNATTLAIFESPCFGDNLYANDGFVTAPSIALKNYPGTGFYAKAANSLSYAANGVEIANLSATGIRGQLVGPNGAYVTVETLANMAGSPTAGCGAGTAFSAGNDAAPPVEKVAGFFGAQLTTVTNGAEIGVAEMKGAALGVANGAGLRVRGVGGGTIVNGVEVIPAVSGADPTISPLRLGAVPDTNRGIKITQAGTGTIVLDAGGTGSVQVGNNTAAKLGFNGATPIAKVSAATNADSFAHLQAWFQLIGLMTA